MNIFIFNLIFYNSIENEAVVFMCALSSVGIQCKFFIN